MGFSMKIFMPGPSDQKSTIVCLNMASYTVLVKFCDIWLVTLPWKFITFSHFEVRPGVSSLNFRGCFLERCRNRCRNCTLTPFRASKILCLKTQNRSILPQNLLSSSVYDIICLRYGLSSFERCITNHSCSWLPLMRSSCLLFHWNSCSVEHLTVKS